MAKKRHHYISNFLCKNFSVDQTRFFRFDNIAKKIISTSTKDGFVEKHLYRLKKIGGGFETDKLEDFFSNYYEGPASGAINKLIIRISGEEPPAELLTQKEFIDILRFCILSHLRTPNKINEISLSQLRMVYTIAFAHLHAIGNQLDDNFRLQNNRDKLLIEMLQSGEEVLKKLLPEVTVSVIHHKSTCKFFVLPDQPVAIHSSDDKEFGSKDLQIFFPVSSRMMIVFERSKVQDALREVDENQIDELNLLACGRYYNYIACENENYLSYFTQTFKPTAQPVQSEKEIETEINKIITEVINNITLDSDESNLIHLSRNRVNIYKVPDNPK